MGRELCGWRDGGERVSDEEREKRQIRMERGRERE